MAQDDGLGAEERVGIRLPSTQTNRQRLHHPMVRASLRQWQTGVHGLGPGLSSSDSSPPLSSFVNWELISPLVASTSSF